MAKRTKAIKITDIKGDKPWLKKKGITPYRKEKFELNKTFLIVCEGQTESLYFKSFPTISAKVKAYDMGCSNTKLAECTIALAEDDDYDEVWCVFDLDIKPGDSEPFEDFNNAIEICQSNNVKCAYSNDAFELWFYLHYQYTDNANHRTFYYEQLSNRFNFNYVREGKKRSNANAHYKRLQDDPNASQEEAIKRAEKLDRDFGNISPHLKNPVTMIYKLVIELNEHLD